MRRWGTRSGRKRATLGPSLAGTAACTSNRESRERPRVAHTSPIVWRANALALHTHRGDGVSILKQTLAWRFRFRPETRMHTYRSRLQFWRAAMLAALIVCFSANQPAPAQPAWSLVPALQERFGLSEQQVRGALGALLVFSRERLAKPAFDDLAERIPNAERIMQAVKQSGIVTKPIDNVGEYESILVRLGIAPSVAAQFAPAVVDLLGAAGYGREQDILWGVLH